MAGYTPWMAGAKAAAERANKAAIARHIATLRQQYNEERAEARACGYEFQSFPEWLGPETCKDAGIRYTSGREAAEERVMGGQSYAEWHRTADMY